MSSQRGSQGGSQGGKSSGFDPNTFRDWRSIVDSVNYYRSQGNHPYGDDLDGFYRWCQEQNRLSTTGSTTSSSPTTSSTSGIGQTK